MNTSVRIERRFHRWLFSFVLMPVAGIVLGLLALLLLLTRQQQVPAAALGWALAAGAGLVAVVYFSARAYGRRHILDPMRRTADAGNWVLRTAFAKDPASALAGRDPNRSIEEDLNLWLQGLQQRALTQTSAISDDVKRDLELATEFQQAFFNRPPPQIPEVHVEGRLRLEFHHRYRPALAIGGDFFDIEALAPDCAGIFVADVMGHGTRSALITAIIRTLLGELYHQGRYASRVIRDLNQEFCDMVKALPHPVFASATYFVADTTARVATYSVAGHPPPFHLHRGLRRVSRLPMPKPHGTALGIVPNEEYGGESVRLAPDDVFVFFTDGVYEANNRQGEEFGLARLERVLQANIYRPVPEILDAALDAITKFVGDEPVADDICMVAVGVTTAARKPDGMA